MDTDEITRQIDHAFYLAEYTKWVREWEAHLKSHKGPLSHTIAGNAPAGEHCQFCADIIRQVEHWRERANETAWRPA